MKLCAHVEGAGAAMRRNGSAPSASALVAPPERKPAPELDGAGGGREEQTAPRSRPFDTLKAATRLREEAGFDEKQATALVQTFADRGVENLATREELAAVRGEMATREDLAAVRGEITVLRGDLEKTELALRGDMEKNVASLRGDMHKLEQRMTMRLGTVIAAGVAIVVALDKLL